MPRKPSPDGRRVHVNVMLSEPEEKLFDSVRGSAKLGPWIREAALEVARRQAGVLPAAVADLLHPANTTQRRILDEIYAEAERECQEPSARPMPCKHPANRRIGDYCAACERTVGSGT